jgi:membrane protease YdiL (CAAX protease family)
MQAASPGNSPALPKLVLFLLAVMFGGALLAVPLFHLGKTGHAWLSASALHESGLVGWLLAEIEKANFTRYFNRAVLVTAIVLIWPFLRWVRLDGSSLPKWRPFSLGVKQWGLGFALATSLLLMLGFVFFQLGAYQLRPDAAWWQFGAPITSALGASLVEELFFRGLLLSLLLRTMSPRAALLAGTFVFAVVHFLKPPEGWQIEDAAVTWNSGFLVLWQIAEGFGNVEFLLAEFATLFAVGWVLAQVRMQTGALWAGMGLHAGWVFGLKWFSALSSYNTGWLPWIGGNLKIGLAPLLTVLVTGWIASRLLPTR